MRIVITGNNYVIICKNTKSIFTLTSFNEISSKADICIRDMEQAHQGMLLKAHTGFIHIYQSEKGFLRVAKCYECKQPYTNKYMLLPRYDCLDTTGEFPCANHTTAGEFPYRLDVGLELGLTDTVSGN